jgi:hypothetical protein
VALFGCAGRAADSSLAVRHLDTPAPPGSGEPNLAALPDGRVLLSFLEPAGAEGHRLRAAVRTPGGAWSEPATIAQGRDWFVNWADFPSVMALPDGTLFAHWLAKSGPATYAYDVETSASRDAGRSWSAPLVPHRDGTRTEHGFVSMIPWSAREVGLAWLDGRKGADAAPGAHGRPGAETALYHTTLDAAGRLGPETLLDPRVCDCCQTDAALAGDVAIVVYRDRSEAEVRDISLVRFVEGRWSAPRTLAPDGWKIDGCPVNGPAVAASGSEVAVAWFSAARGTSRVNVAFSRDAGESFGAPIAVDDGRPLGRVDVVLLERGVALVSWLEKTTLGAALRLRRLRADGAQGTSLTVADAGGARSSGFPRLCRSGDEVVVAWRDAGDRGRVRTASVTWTAD